MPATSSCRISVIAVLLLCCSIASAQPAADTAVLGSLRPEHPRLYLTSADWQHVKEIIVRDPTAAAWQKQLLADADKAIDEKPVVHKLIGPRLLDQSRAALRRITLLAAEYRLTGDHRYADRARTELLTAAAFSDWNPSHFLDVAEMTNAVATGYDWLYDVLSPDDRRTLRQALIDKGLNEGLKAYTAPKKAFWVTANHNWNQVCNGGLTVGALAIADEQPDLAAKILQNARESIPLAMHSFAPDGGWAEGPGYWDYATRYTVFYLAALHSAFGDFGPAAQSPGLAQTGLFRIYFTSPIDRTFNYADVGGDSAGEAPQMFWFARAFDAPIYASHQRLMLISRAPTIFDLLWYDPSGPAADKWTLPLNAIFRGVNVAFLRSSWTDRNAFYVGFKGGDNKANHAHLDLGTLVLDALGQRWAIDLGSDDYNLPGYFGDKRWTYYRLRTEGHNTLLIDGANQDTKAKAPLLAFSAAPENAYAVADLTQAYPQTKRALRGVALVGGNTVVVQDELSADHPIDVAWHMNTAAKAIVQGNRAQLELNGQTLIATLLSPADATFTATPLEIPPPQHPANSITLLSVALPAKVTSAKIVVRFTAAEAPATMPAPLDQWINAHPLPPVTPSVNP